MNAKLLFLFIGIALSLQGCGEDNNATVNTTPVVFPANLQSFVIKNDYDNDGSLDAIHSAQYSYDETGKLTEEIWECDHNFNEVIDNKEIYTYGPFVKLKQADYFYDYNDDYLIDSTDTVNYTYNSAGLLVGLIANIDHGQDNIIDITYTDNYTYDDDGDRIGHTSNKMKGGVSTDNLATYAYTYFPDGKVDTYSVSTSDSTVASDEITTRSFTYNAAGNVEEMVKITAPNDDSIQTTRFFYRDATHLSSIVNEIDSNGDNFPDTRETQTVTYDAANRPIQTDSIAVSLPDELFLGSQSASTIYTANGKEANTTIESDSNNDGIPESSTIYEMVFNESGMTDKTLQIELFSKVTIPLPLIIAIYEREDQF